MRRAAADYVESLLRDLQDQSRDAAPSSIGSYSGYGQSNAAVVKEKLQTAVQELQSGLVERDTEVGLCTTVSIGTDRQGRCPLLNGH